MCTDGRHGSHMYHKSLNNLDFVITSYSIHYTKLYESRQNAARKYNNALAGHKNIIVPSGNPNCSGICDTCDCHVFHQYTLRVLNTDRDALASHLNENSIPCGVYYPIPLHLQKAYADPRYKEEDFVVTNQLAKEVISLPMHTELDDEQIDFITKTVINFIDNS